MQEKLENKSCLSLTPNLLLTPELSLESKKVQKVSESIYVGQSSNSIWVIKAQAIRFRVT